MKLYFLRHGRADWPEWNRPDDDRPLTKKGREEVSRVGKLLNRLEVESTLILTSPLPRAAETAKIVARQLGLKLREEAAFSPGFNATELRAILKKHRYQDLLLVGHEPDFSIIIGELTGGRIKLAKAAVARVDLDQTGDDGRLIWLIPPKVTKL